MAFCLDPRYQHLDYQTTPSPRKFYLNILFHCFYKCFFIAPYMRVPSQFLFLLASALSAAVAVASPFPIGESRRDLFIADTVIKVHVYKPANYRGGPLLVSFHGLSRDVARYLAAAKPIADRGAMLLVAPLFDRARFPYWRYQGLGITRQSRRMTAGPIPVEPPETWTSVLITRVIEEIRRAEGNPALNYYLMGHSAGGQVANRIAAFAARDATRIRILVANPGSYVQPTRAARFPYGFGALPDPLSDDAMLQRYLAQPMTILTGTADALDENLDRRPAAMAEGANRYERARNVFNTARALARERRWKFNWHLIEVPGVGHDVEAMYRSPQAGLALFGTP
jgi:pimeloyl-ACP methyl ester carboxylesterase